jgi:hypothetical protein
MDTPWDEMTQPVPAPSAAQATPVAPEPAIESLEPPESSDLALCTIEVGRVDDPPALRRHRDARRASCSSPQPTRNRRLTWERERLKADLEQIQKQVHVNDLFLAKLMSDPSLSERLARRQMKMVREGTSVLETKASVGKEELSPFLLVTLPPPAEMPEYQPVGGVLATLCRDPKSQLYMTGAGLLMIACGLVLGSSSPTKD